MALVTEEDIHSYFKKDGVPVSKEEGFISADSKSYSIRVKKEKTLYKLVIENAEDDLDREEMVTENPTKEISNFLKTGTEGDEFLDKISSSPHHLSFVLHHVASIIESKLISKREARMIFNRINSVLLKKKFIISKKETSKLLKEIKSKGWKATETGDSIEVDIGEGLFKATIDIDSIIWNYEFSVHDIPGSLITGHSEDPINEFRSFLRSPKTEEAKKELEEKRNNRQNMDTVPPRRRS